jgi:hypothetical protein
MSNLATLETAPPFTSETARIYSKMGLEAKRAKIREREKQLARPSIEPEINRIVKAMKKLRVESPEHDKLSRKLKDLWSLAFPTQAAVKTGRQRTNYVPAEPDQSP